MAIFRAQPSLLRALARPATAGAQRIGFTSRRYASQDYGSGAGDPKGENPQSQGPNPSANQEHPGPPPPKAGQGSGSTPTKGSHENSSQQGDQQQGGNSQLSSSRASNSKGTQQAQPKILNESPPKRGQGPPDVEAHNKDMENRAEKANAKATDEDVEKDKVHKGFWSGTGGADREP